MRLFALAILFLLSSALNAQYKNIFFNAENRYFDSGQPLPAEQYMMISGFVSDSVEMVSVNFSKLNKTASSTVYENYWKRTPGTTPVLFEVPVNFALRGSRRYDITIEFYERADSANVDSLYSAVLGLVSDYVEANISKHKGKVKLSKSPKYFVEELNALVADTSSVYKHKRSFGFEGFSAFVHDELDNLKGSKIRPGENLTEIKASILSLVEKEVRRFIDYDLLLLSGEILMEQYPVEKTPNIVSLNAGYGLTLPKQYDGIRNSSSPFIGISVPLSNRQYTPAIWKNTAISFGISLRNYQDKEGNKVTGPILRRPMYFALGYKVLKVVRINVGGQLLSVDVDGEAAPLENLKFDPFFGISAEFDVWIGVGRKNRGK